MDRRSFFSLTAVGVVWATGSASASKAPTEWDGLSRVKSKKLEYVFLAPGADFSAYHKVLLDPTEIAFSKDWQRDYNSTRRGISGRVSDSDVQRVIVEGEAAASKIFAEAFAAGGYPVVTAAAPDVLKIRTGIVNLSITAPDLPVAGRSRTFASQAGSASLIIEARDSMTGALLGRAVDHSLAGDNASIIRNSVTNRADFRQITKVWAKNSVLGLNLLKTSPPV